ncbi:hypothetical protein SPRG_10272 [Saprolegnia parasitica CBS 223.65]|uniref:EF-hand domain-containing protein n=1 Tax=Saprolegnia parasitica (strain CBS 223.65) TaxID=695850 RepID=A0A067C2L8_SAPPC|nr:hypothetical protein SPRG_10272 [Saprolegnia parasitica CBS 223.65]KDO24738.1 hypothetical protein SPRG_10272 [Saprolegnia parasitica CBS 223.65]|eukprot:XP_012204618.1 hypothetical protein SPRG_10272 [Saprolegnia parasitica CBS 223.65]
MRALAKIPWPAPEPVDLLAEFGATLVGDVPARPALASAVQFDAKLRRLQADSPYTRPVVARDVQAPLTHAQVAAKRVRHFALKHLALDWTSNQKDASDTLPLTHAAASEGPGSDDFDLQTWLRDANACAIDPQTNVLHATAAAAPLPSVTTTSPTARTLHAPLLPKRNRPHRRPSPTTKRTKAVCAPDDDDDDDGSAIDDIQDTEYILPFEHLKPQDVSTMQHKRAGTTSPTKELRRAKSFHIAKWLTKRMQERAYSKEMQSRLAATLSANVGGGLWKDQVASQLATAMSADVVFGDGSDGNGRPFADDAAALALVLEREWIDTKARDIHDRATTEYAQGHVPEALSILSAGAALLQATTAVATHKSSWGFNYTLEVHAKASLLQMRYRRRHLRRARAALRLQTVWRGFHDRRRFKRRLWHRQASALYIQRWWHVRTADKEAMRLRLQTAARRKLAYLLVRRMRKAHKVLRASIHAWLVCALARLRLRRAIRAATNIQRLVRGFLSRRAVLRLRDRIVRDEVARSSREADYIQRFTAIRLEDFLLFLHQAGQSHVHQLAQRLKDEATARKRARAHWAPAAMRRAALEDLFASYDVDGSGTIDVDELQHLFDELCIPMDAASLAQAIRLMDTSRNGSVDMSEFCAYLEAPPPQSNAGLWKLHAQLQLQRVANWFTSATFKNEARRRLVYDETQRQAQLLRTEFRMTEHPRFACPYCGAAFALYRPFWRHMRQRQCPAASNRRLDTAHQVDADDDLAAVEQALVDARLVEVERDVALYMATSPGKADLAADATRLQQRYLALRQRRTLRDLAHNSNAILELYHSYDMAETNALPALLVPDIAADVGLGRAELALHFATDHAVTMDEVFIAVRRAYISLSWCTRLQQLLPSFLFTSSRRQRRLRQAATCLLLREQALAEASVRAAFRSAHPPVLVCQACNTGLWHDARARLHLQDDRFHARDASYRHRRNARIHLTATSTSRLVQLTQLSQDAVRAQAMQKALRFCKRQEGRRAIHAVTKHLLTQLAPQTAVNEPRRLLDVAFQLVDVDRVGSIPAESVAPVLAFLQCTALGASTAAAQAMDVRSVWRHRRATALATHVVATTYLQSKATLDVVPHVDVHAYLATPVGRQAIADEEALFGALQTTTTTDLTALVLQQLDVDRSRRIRVEHLATLLYVLGYAHATRTVATLRSAVPASDGHVPSDTLRAWLTAHPPRRCMLGRRWRLRCVRTRLARAVVTARYEGSAAACAPDPISHDALLVAKSEHFSKSAIGRDAIRTKVAELKRLEKVFAASTKGVRGHAWRSARARFLFCLFERGHAGAIELVDVPCVLRDLCHPLQKDPNVMARMLRFLNLEATTTTTISETAFHRWLDTDAGRAPSRRLAWRPSTKALATAVVRFEHRSDLGQREDDVLPLHVLAKADMYCASVAGQHEIDEEETHVQAQLGQHRRKTRGLAALEHKVAYAALLFRLVDANHTGRVAAHALSTLLGLLQLPNDLPLAHCIARDVGDATGHLDEAAFLAWYRGALDRQSLRTRLLAALRQTPVRAIATAVVAARYRQSREQPTEPSEGCMAP